jgi:peptidoglycan/LPS O-acetylase OafA/YrhL
MIPHPSGRIDALDGWRSISIGFVIFSHIFLYSNMHFTGSGKISQLLLIPLLDELGFLGVKVFFVISGFVICRGLILERTKFGQISLIGFYIRRIFRIIPPLCLYVASIYCLARLGTVEGHATAILRALTFTCNFPTADCGGYLGAHTWSLSVEEQFYLVIPILLSLVNLRSHFIGLILVPTIFFCVILLSLFHMPAAARFLSEFLPISIGVACALHEDRIKHWVHNLGAGYLYGAAFVLVLTLRLTDTRVWEIAAAIEAFAIAAILMMTIFKTSQAQKILASTGFVAVGRVSYSIYLWQQLATYPFAGAGLGFYLLSLVGCVVFAFASYQLFELPLIERGRVLSRRWSNRPAVPRR